MNRKESKSRQVLKKDPIDDYLECVTFCSLENRIEENDCQTICMERHLQVNYF